MVYLYNIGNHINSKTNRHTIMKTEQIGKHVVKIYDSIEEMPIVRFHRYNKMLLIDSGIGSDLQDINVHIEKAIKLIAVDQALAVTELRNMQQSIHLINETINPKHLAFSVLVAEIDGKPVTDLSDDGLQETLHKLQETPKGLIDRLIDSVKKKMDSELTLYFPTIFEDTSTREYFDKLKQRTVLILESIISGENNEILVEKIDNYLITLAKPKVFSGSESEEIKFDKQFIEMSMILSHHIGKDTNYMTVTQYYLAFEYLKKTLKTDKK